MPYLNDLPEQTQDQVRATLHNVLRTNVDNVATNGGGRVEGKGLVLLYPEHIQFCLVDSSLIHSVGHGGVDQLAVCECVWVSVSVNVCVCGGGGEGWIYHKLAAK